MGSHNSGVNVWLCLTEFCPCPWSQLIDFYLWMVFPPIGSKNPIPTQYTLHNCMLESVSSAKYLGVDISSDLSWNTHINGISKKANDTLGFLRRNIKIHSDLLKSSAYKVFVRPQSTAPQFGVHAFTDSNISKLEAVRCRLD